MSAYINTTAFATTTTTTTTTTTAAPTFHATSTTKRGCGAVMEDDTSLQHERNYKRMKISSPRSMTGFVGTSYQPQLSFQAPISSGSTYFTYGGESQTKKRGRRA